MSPYYLIFANAGLDSVTASLDLLVSRVNEAIQEGSGTPVGGPFWTNSQRGWAQAMLHPGSPEKELG